MAPSSPDSRQSGTTAALAMLAAACNLLHVLPVAAAAPAAAASNKCETRDWTIKLEESTRTESGNVSISDLTLSQCSTVLRASKAEATIADNGADNDFRNGTWRLSGKVRLEFDGATLDADAATIVLVDNRLSNVNVSRTSPSSQAGNPVHVEFKDAVLDVDAAAVDFVAGRMRTIRALGSPAQFAWQMKTGRRVHGRSPRIDYDAEKTLLRVNSASYFYGNTEGDAQVLEYNFNDGTLTTRKLSGINRPDDELVPPPRTPDRTTAK